MPPRAREAPLTPCAAVAEGLAAARLARRLLASPDAALARLSGVAAPGLIAVTGEAADLPWVDGVRYLGRSPAAPALLLPTAEVLELPDALLERVLLGRAGEGDAPLGLLTRPLRVVPFGRARPVARALLELWLAGEP